MRRVIPFLAISALAGYIVFFALVYALFNKTPITQDKIAFSHMEDEYADRCLQYEKALLSFVYRAFLKENGEIHTNTIFTSGDGGDTLSESIGLLMEYSVLKRDKALFDKEFGFLKARMLHESKLVKWKAGSVEINCNAAIDDLRIVRALLDAYNLWDEKEYFDTAGFIQHSIYSKQVDNGYLMEFYDWKLGLARKSIPLCYLDLYTLDRSSIFNEGWGEVVNKGLDIIKNGRINGTSPIFYKYYDYTTGKYSMDEEYAKEKGVCLVETLYTVIHLAEVNEDTGYFTQWVKGEIGNGRLAAWYNPYTLKPSKEMENPAVYALAAVYAKKVGETELYKAIIDKMTSFMVLDKNSESFGGLGDNITQAFYSFDNLTALWALACR
ncbi:MAG: glycosyl hydrolase family 8 [Clostridia bacterium]|nr:glycosyl hydrolase family 8 [Clostridia bacterium]